MFQGKSIPTEYQICVGIRDVSTPARWSGAERYIGSLPPPEEGIVA